MEHLQRTLKFNPRKITEDEREYASNSYLMSLFALFAGLPIPIFNLLATIIFYFGNRKTTKFVKWHCTQALISQLFIFCFNTIAFWWTIDLLVLSQRIYTEKDFNTYFSYIILVILINVVEIISTFYTCVQVRKGIHVNWFLFGEITDKIVSSNEDTN